MVYLMLFLMMVAVSVIAGIFSPNFSMFLVVAAFPWEGIWVSRPPDYEKLFLICCIALNIVVLIWLSKYFWWESRQSSHPDSPIEP